MVVLVVWTAVRRSIVKALLLLAYDAVQMGERRRLTVAATWLMPAARAARAKVPFMVNEIKVMVLVSYVGDIPGGSECVSLISSRSDCIRNKARVGQKRMMPTCRQKRERKKRTVDYTLKETRNRCLGKDVNTTCNATMGTKTYIASHGG